MNNHRPAPTRLYHNARCSKSRGALELLQARGITPELVYYLETAPDADELRWLLGLLGASARDLLRSGDAGSIELGLGRSVPGRRSVDRGDDCAPKPD